MVWGLLFDWALFRQAPTLLSVLGAAVVCSGSLLVVLSERRGGGGSSGGAGSEKLEPKFSSLDLPKPGAGDHHWQQLRQEDAEGADNSDQQLQLELVEGGRLEVAPR